MADIQESPLPGVGVRRDFLTKAGERIGVLAHQTGERDLLIYDRDSPENCREIRRLDPSDSRALAGLLGAPVSGDAVSRLQHEVEGLVVDWMPVKERWRCAGHTIRDYGLRTETGVSIVAVLREEQTIPAPVPDFRMKAGDTLVVVGTAEGVKEALTLLRGS
ncbi:MAG TPA: TrkA C-terminal domain-containing protein [Egibacteraceae bacterium]|nr:TrkA C-terminal domain-containing protein [Egibacteraceae bacterium]